MMKKPLNHFERTLTELSNQEGLYGETLDTLQVNLGFKCNLRCRHCHLRHRRKGRGDGLARDGADSLGCKGFSVQTCGPDRRSPELNPFFRRFVIALGEKVAVQVRTNLTLLIEPEWEDLPQFFKRGRSSSWPPFPATSRKNVCLQRGEGVFERSIEVIRRLNALGYGREAALPLNSSTIPAGPSCPHSRWTWRQTTDGNWPMDRHLIHQAAHPHKHALGAVFRRSFAVKESWNRIGGFSGNPSIPTRYRD